MMSITSGAAALARLAHRRTRTGGLSAGRTLRGAALVVGASATAYIAGGRRGHAAERAQLDRIAELERRVAQLESAAAKTAAATAPEPRHLRAVTATAADRLDGDKDPDKDGDKEGEGVVDKDRAASHYEVLASQLACERQIIELEDRLAAVERTGSPRRTATVWLASANGTTTTGLRRRV
jgi:hypothetical protein